MVPTRSVMATCGGRGDKSTGATSNQDDPEVGFSVGEEVSLMLDPTPLLGSLRFISAGRARVAGRDTFTGDAVPRLSDARPGGARRTLWVWGTARPWAPGHDRPPHGVWHTVPLLHGIGLATRIFLQSFPRSLTRS